MKAVQIHEAGWPDVLTLADLPIPGPKPEIGKSAISVNFIEVYFRKGVYKAALPLILCRWFNLNAT